MLNSIGMEEEGDWKLHVKVGGERLEWNTRSDARFSGLTSFLKDVVIKKIIYNGVV